MLQWLFWGGGQHGLAFAVCAHQWASGANDQGACCLFLTITSWHLDSYVCFSASNSEGHVQVRQWRSFLNQMVPLFFRKCRRYQDTIHSHLSGVANSILDCWQMLTDKEERLPAWINRKHNRWRQVQLHHKAPCHLNDKANSESWVWKYRAVIKELQKPNGAITHFRIPEEC